jgi:hypothetical protein
VALKYTIDPFTLALKMATKDSSSESSSGSSSALTALFPFLPESTSESKRGLDTAIILLDTINAHLKQSDKFKQALFLTASISLKLKGINASGTGTISPAEAANLSEEDALAILNNLDSASSVLGETGGSDGSRSQASNEKIQSIKSAIAEQPGATQSEQLKSYIASKK